MGAAGGEVLAFLIGLVLAGLVAFALARTLMRVTATTAPKALLRFVWAGLLPGNRHDGIAAQRSLAKLLKESYSVMASGRRVAAAAVDIHVSPEDFRLITSSIGTDAAVADLTDFYVSYARDNQWHLVSDPVITLKRDISLRARQAYAQRTVHPPEADAEDPVTGDLDAADLREADLQTDVLPPATGRPAQVSESVTDLLPSRRLGEPDGVTRPYEARTEVLGDGDLIVVHGTDVRMVPREKGRATIGRSSRADLVIDRPGVSRDHAVVELRDDGWWVVPLDAKNGTLLDGRPLQGPSRLPPESTLGLGARVKLKVTIESLQP
ncbi:MAG TPA: FhaA domain-containing protein [Amnibacterium sp.]|nr:FhaA domain-containing protein [Amnibacterium sp.]